MWFALLTESVDRNLGMPYKTSRAGVALLTESVDRNCFALDYLPDSFSRSPHGERG